MPDSRLLVAFTYVIVSLGALSNHEYLLERSLLAPALALFIATGWAMSTSKLMRSRSVILLCFVLALAGWRSVLPQRNEALDHYYPPHLASLVPASDAVVESLDDHGLLRVVGSFNEFSPGWVRILQERHTPSQAVAVDVTYPLEAARTHLAADWSSLYSKVVDSWSKDGTRTILAIEVEPFSQFYTEDYRLWNAWKRNLVTALDDSDAFVKTAEHDVAAGVRVSKFQAAHTLHDAP